MTTTIKRLNKHFLLATMVTAFAVFIMGCSSTTNLTSTNVKLKGFKFVKANPGKVNTITRKSDNTVLASLPSRSFTTAQPVVAAQPIIALASASNNDAVASTLISANSHPIVAPEAKEVQSLSQIVTSPKTVAVTTTNVTKVKGTKPKGSKTKMILLGLLAYLTLGGAMATVKHVKDAKNNKANYGGGCKSWIAAVLFSFFLGGLGIHRFYLGYTWQGIVQLLTAGGCGIWALIDFIRICVKDLNPKDGDYCN